MALSGPCVLALSLVTRHTSLVTALLMLVLATADNDAGQCRGHCEGAGKPVRSPKAGVRSMASSGPCVLALSLVTRHTSLVTALLMLVLATADNDAGECRGHCEGAGKPVRSPRAGVRSMALSGPCVLALSLVTRHTSLVTALLMLVLATADNDTGECRGHCEGAGKPVRSPKAGVRSMALSGPCVLALSLVTRHTSLVTALLMLVLATADNDTGECRGHCEGAEVAQPLLAVPSGGNAAGASGARHEWGEGLPPRPNGGAASGREPAESEPSADGSKLFGQRIPGIFNHLRPRPGRYDFRPSFIFIDISGCTFIF